MDTLRQRRVRKGATVGALDKEWLSNDPLHLQMMAFDHAGLGSWEGRDRAVPVTIPGEHFALPRDVRGKGGFHEPSTYEESAQEPLTEGEHWTSDDIVLQPRLVH